MERRRGKQKEAMIWVGSGLVVLGIIFGISQLPKSLDEWHVPPPPTPYRHQRLGDTAEAIDAQTGEVGDPLPFYVFNCGGQEIYVPTYYQNLSSYAEECKYQRYDYKLSPHSR